MTEPLDLDEMESKGAYAWRDKHFRALIAELRATRAERDALEARVSRFIQAGYDNGVSMLHGAAIYHDDVKRWAARAEKAEAAIARVEAVLEAQMIDPTYLAHAIRAALWGDDV